MRFQGLDLNLLVALDALIKHRNVSSAARTLNLTQSAMSGALSRLRGFFNDQLLVQNGREMILTPKAESLASVVREALIHIQSNITNPPIFDAASSSRRFVVIASDYMQSVLLDEIIRQASHTAPTVAFRILSPSDESFAQFERGEVDVAIVVDAALIPTHPARLLFEDEPVAVCWDENGQVGKRLSLELFQDLGHVTTSLGLEREGSLFDVMLRDLKVKRRIEVQVPAFSLMLGALVGTNRIAIIHRRLAEHYATLMPLRVAALPFELPAIREFAQWHALRQSDQGLRWLLEQLTRSGQDLGCKPH